MGVGGQHLAPTALPAGQRPGAHCTGGWVGRRAGLDGCGKSRLHRESNFGPSSPQRVAMPTTLSRPKPPLDYKKLFKNERKLL